MCCLHKYDCQECLPWLAARQRLTASWSGNEQFFRSVSTSICVSLSKAPTSFHWTHRTTIFFFAAARLLPWSTSSGHGLCYRTWGTWFQLKKKMSNSFSLICRQIFILWVHSLTKLSSSRLIKERLWTVTAHLFNSTTFLNDAALLKADFEGKAKKIALAIIPHESWMFLDCRHQKISMEAYWVHLIWASFVLPTLLMMASWMYWCLVWF